MPLSRADLEDDGYYAYHVVTQKSSQPILDRSRSFAAAQSVHSVRRTNYSDHDDASTAYGSYTSEKTWKDDFDEGRRLKAAWAPAWAEEEEASRWRTVSKSWISRLLFLLLIILAAILVPIFVTRTIKKNNDSTVHQAAPAAVDVSAVAVSSFSPSVTATATLVAETTVTSLQTQTRTVVQQVFETVTLYQPRQTTVVVTSSQQGGSAQVYTSVQTYTAPVTATLSSISGAAPAEPTAVSTFPTGATVYSNSFATFFLQEGRAGNCGTVHSDSDFVVALTTQMYESGQYCGKSVLIRRVSNGKTVTATVADSCPTCNTATSLDLSVAAFRQIATDDEGYVPIQWSFLD